MKKINLRFDLDKQKEDIDVVFTASKKDEQVLSLMDRVRDPLSEKIMAYDSEGFAQVIPERSIISVSIANKKLTIVAEDGTYEIKSPLRELEKLLHPAVFLKISRYEIINIDQVKKFHFPISGSLQIELSNGMKTWASRRFIPVIKKRFMERGQES